MYEIRNDRKIKTEDKLNSFGELFGSDLSILKNNLIWSKRVLDILSLSSTYFNASVATPAIFLSSVLSLLNSNSCNYDKLV